MKIASSVSTSGYEPKMPPARAARELLASREDLAGQPFGRLVSKIARGQDIPVPPPPPEVEPPAEEPTPSTVVTMTESTVVTVDITV